MQVPVQLDRVLRSAVDAVELNNLPVPAAGLSAIANRCGATLTVLRLVSCALGDVGAFGVGRMLRVSRTLRVLDLQSNDIGALGCRAIGHALGGNASLQVLSLDRNVIPDEGFTDFARALGHNVSLRSLNVAHNCPHEGAPLADLTHVLPFNVTGNTGESRRGISHLLKRAVSLTELRCGGNALAEGGIQALFEELSSNTLLRTLDLRGEADLNSIFTWCTARLLHENETVTELLVDGTTSLAVDSAAVVAFCSALEHNRFVTHLFVPAFLVGSDRFRAAVDRNQTLVKIESSTGTPYALLPLLERNQFLSKSFCDAVAAGMVAQATSMQQHSPGTWVPPVLQGGSDGTTLWHAAVMAGAPMVAVLLQHSVALHMLFSPLSDGVTTPLRLAAKRSRGVSDLMRCFAADERVLMYACARGHDDTVQALLDAGATVVRPDGELTPLQMAAQMGHLRVVEVLLQHAAVVPLARFAKNGLTCLHMAIYFGFADICDTLLETCPALMFADTRKGTPPLILAAQADRAEVCRLLIAHGADVDATMHNSTNALDVCTTVDVANVLLECGADVATYGSLTLTAALEQSRVDVVTALLDFALTHNLTGTLSVAKSIRTATKIHSLDLRDQCRETLPLWIGALPNLSALHVVQGNPLSSIARNVVAEGDSGVLRYLQDMCSSDKQSWSRVKVLTLGKEGAGKTHLMHLLAGHTYARNESTDGIDISTVRLPGCFDLTWFDFGGQEVFYPTHQFFLTTKSVYVLVFSMADADYRSRIKYWLDCIHHFGGQGVSGSAKIVLVGTHLDVANNAAAVEADVRLMVSTQDSVVATVFVSCVANEQATIDAMQRSIMLAAKAARLGVVDVPKTYAAVANWADDRRQRGISHMTRTEMAACFPGFDDALLRQCCTFLHDMGEIFYAKSIGIVFTDVQWLSKMFSSLLSFKHSWVKSGQVKESELRHVWRDFVRDPDEIPAIMELFTKFEVAFRQRGDPSTWLVPSMLGLTEPLVIPKTMRVVQARVFRFRVLPAGAFGRLLARVQNWSDLKMTSLWRNGFTVCIEGAAPPLPSPSPAGSSVPVRLTKPLPAKPGAPSSVPTVRTRVAMVKPSILGSLARGSGAKVTAAAAAASEEHKAASETAAAAVSAVAPRVVALEYARVVVDGSDILLHVLRPDGDMRTGGDIRGDLLRRLAEELQQLVRAVFANSLEPPVQTFLVCPHCLACGTPLADCTQVQFVDCMRLVMAKQSVFPCARAPAGELPVSLLGADINFGYAHTYGDDEVAVEPEAFAKGGFGQIYLAELAATHEPVVAKELSEGVQGDALDNFHSFQHEVSVMARLSHPNLVRLYGVMLAPLRMIIEFCPAGDLLQNLRSGNVCKHTLKVRIAVDIARGMQYLHGQSPPLAHRDLRSPNVFLMHLGHEQGPCAKVADFGLTVAASSLLVDPLLTWRWMAPQAYMGTNYDERCDLYSFAIVMWEISTGKAPFDREMEESGLAPNDVIRSVMEGSLRPHIGEGALFPELMAAMWAHEPAARPSFTEALDHMVAGKRLVVRNAAQPKTDCLVRPFFSADHAAMASTCAVGSAPDGSAIIVVGSLGGEVTIFGPGPTVLTQLPAQHASAVVAACVSADGAVWTAGGDGSIACCTPDNYMPKAAARAIRSSASSIIVGSVGSGARSRAIPIAGGSARMSAQRSDDALPTASPSSGSKSPHSPRSRSPRMRDVPKSPRAGGSRWSINSASDALAPGAEEGGILQRSLGILTGSLRKKDSARTSLIDLRRPSGGSDLAPGHKGAAVTAMCWQDDDVLSADRTGAVCMWRRGAGKSEPTTAEAPLNFGVKITAMVFVEREVVWVAAGHKVFRLEKTTSMCKSLLDLGAPIVFMTLVARDRVWIVVATSPTQHVLQIWDTGATARIKTIELMGIVGCMACVQSDESGIDTVWIGSKDVVTVYSLMGRKLQTLPTRGNVTHIQPLGSSTVGVVSNRTLEEWTLFGAFDYYRK